MKTQFTRPSTEEELQQILRKIDSSTQKGHYHDALAGCEFLIEDSSTKAAGLRERATVFEQMGEMQKSISDLRELIAMDMGEPADLHQLGILVLSFGSAREAVDLFSKTVEVGTKENFHYYTNSSYLHRAEAFLRLGDYAAAEADCAKLPDGYKTYMAGVGMRTKEQIQMESASKKPRTG